MDELRLILLGIGLVILVLIYLWGMRKQIRERLEERRRRAQARVPENEPQLPGDDTVRDGETDVWSEPEIRVIRPASTAARASHSESDSAGVGGPEPAVSESPVSRPTASRPTSPKSPVTAGADSAGADSTGADSTGSDTVSDPTSVEAHDAPEPVATEPDPPAASPDARRAVPGSAELRSRRRRVADEMTVLLTVMAPSGQQLRGGAIRVACETSDLVLGEGGVWECRSEATDDQAMIFGIAHLREPGTFSADALNTLETPGLLLFMQLPGPLDPVPAVDLMIAVAGRLARRLGATVCDQKRNRMSTQAMIRLRADAAEFERHMQESDDA